MDEPPEQVTAFTGLPVVLPCTQTLTEGSEVPTIEWSKLNLSPTPYVYVYRQNFEVYAEKHRDFEFRTHLFITKLQHGNFSMRLSNVRLEDAGIYLCKTIWDKNKQDIKRVELVVEDLPDPQLSVVGSDDGEVKASCVVHSCSTVMLRVTLRDADGGVSVMENMDPSQKSKNASGCYRVEQSIIAKLTAKSVVCRVEFAEVGQSKEKCMLIPELVKESCLLPIIYAASGTGGTVFLLMAGLVFLIHKRPRKSSENSSLVRQSTTESSASSSSENRSLLRAQDSCLIAIPEEGVPEQNQSTLTEAPDLICSATTSVNSNQDGRTYNLIDLFGSTDDGEANEAACEIKNDSIKFEQGKKAKLTRQDAYASDLVLAKEAPPNVTQNQVNAISKPHAPKYPLKRSKSASDSISVTLEALKKTCPRRSFGSLKFGKLSEEDPEQDLL
ncbi:hypothetical protein NL108_009626 [Boleophthalmus pectinirostris]|nr:hypothetical protein NL108_009626 [Boleophthalmus pectinirostris]